MSRVAEIIQGLEGDAACRSDIREACEMLAGLDKAVRVAHEAMLLATAAMHNAGAYMMTVGADGVPEFIDTHPETEADYEALCAAEKAVDAALVTIAPLV